MKPRTFLAIMLLTILVGRLGAVFITPASDHNIDLSIYREAGELVVNGVDPYDFTSQSELRERLRLDDVGTAEPWVKEPLSRYNYYVSSNLPGSTMLYAALEFLSAGNPKIWRAAFVLGDISIALAAFFFLRRVGVDLQDTGQKITFAAAVVGYPSLIEWGTLWPEDKQFQTALMLLLAGLLVATPKSPIRAAVGIGVTGSLSILFKALGIFLLPSTIRYFSNRPRREALIAVLAFAITTLPFVLLFNLAFIRLMLDRVSAGSAFTVAAHGSPWTLLPEAWVSYSRPLACMVLVALTATYYSMKKIDLLNGMASLNLIFICLWVNGGSMDRMNIAMMFALMCVATLSVRYWRGLTLFNFAIQAPIYTIVMMQHFRRNPLQNMEQLDAAATAIFLIAYFYCLFLHPFVSERVFRLAAALRLPGRATADQEAWSSAVLTMSDARHAVLLTINGCSHPPPCAVPIEYFPRHLDLPDSNNRYRQPGGR